MRGWILLPCLLASLSCAPQRDEATFLTVWEQMDPAEQQLLAKHLEEFERLHPGVTIETNHFETENLRTQFQTAALAGAGPDLVYGPSDQVGPFSIMGLIEPLEALVPPAELDLFLSNAKPGLEGHVYALADQVGNHLTLVYNKALVPQPPTDFEDWLRMAKEQTVDLDGDGQPDRYGIVFNLVEPFWLVPWLGAFGGWVMDENSDPTLDSSAMREALALLRRVVQEKVIPRDCDYPLADTLFKEGSAAFIVNGPWSWQGYRDAGIDVGLALLPQVPGQSTWPAPMTACKAYSVNVHVPAARRALVLELLSFLTSARVVEAVSRGLGALPSRTDVASQEWVRADENLQASFAQVEKGRLMPVVPEMRAVWDAIRPAYQSVLGGSMDPDDAARSMQVDAVRKIAEMRG